MTPSTHIHRLRHASAVVAALLAALVVSCDTRSVGHESDVDGAVDSGAQPGVDSAVQPPVDAAVFVPGPPGECVTGEPNADVQGHTPLGEVHARWAFYGMVIYCSSNPRIILFETPQEFCEYADSVTASAEECYQAGSPGTLPLDVSYLDLSLNGPLVPGSMGAVTGSIVHHQAGESAYTETVFFDVELGDIYDAPAQSTIRGRLYVDDEGWLLEGTFEATYCCCLDIYGLC